MKSFGTMEGVYINGAPQGITFHETDNFTLYPASILTVNKNRFTKHYFIGSQRIASRIGTGTFNNVYGMNGSYVTAGQQDYAERMNQIQSQKEAYYKQLGVAPGVPTEKGAYGDPENTGVGYNSVLTELGNHDVPQGWVQTPKHNTTEGSTPGTPVSWNEPSNPDDPQAGYGFIPNDTTTEETFFFHSDHLGSTSYITDDKGNITQYDAYLPYGELLVDEHSSSEEMPYKFNGKELDEETGLYYYGARYMEPVASIWYGVDPLAEKNVATSGYVYTLDNPIHMVDPDGRDSYYTKNGSFVFKNLAKTDHIYIISKFKVIGRSKRKIYYKVWGCRQIDDKNVSLSPRAYSKIYTNVLKRKGYKTNKLKNNAVSIVKLNYNTKSDGPEYELAGTYNHDAVLPWSDAPVAETNKEKNKIQLTVFIHPTGDSERRSYLSTESNVESVLGVHEFTGHGELGINSGQHWKILQMQRRHPSWGQTTQSLKELYKYLEYNKPSEYVKH